jgi:diguanylate cyclase (GGDEF)-like protein
MLAAPLISGDGPTGGTPRIERRAGTWFALAGTSFHHAANGALAAWRAADRGSWTEDDLLLLAGVAGQIGIAHAQADYQARLLHLSEHDEMTGLLNRRSFMERLGHIVTRGAGTGALLYIDLDNFKAVNDRFGHQQGDQVLRKVADLLRDGIRPGDMAGRLGGDEFVVWLARIDETRAEVTAMRLIAGMAALEALSVPERPLGLSIGIAVHHPGPETVSRLLERADTAMYAAKGAGKSMLAMAPPVEAG